MTDLDTTSLEKAEREIDRFVENRAQGRKEANRREEEMDRSLRRRQLAEREENRALWYSHFMKMADTHSEISADYLRRAHELYEPIGESDG